MIELYKYQKEAVNKAYLLGAAHLLCCDPGTGKTAMELALISHRLKIGDIRNCLVISPVSIMWSAWEKDIQKFQPHLTFEVLWHRNAAKRVSLLEGFNKDIAIINYEVIKKYFNLLKGRFDQIVLDESTKIKNKASKTSRKVLQLGKLTKFRSALSATPGHRPEHYWSQMSFLDPDIFNMGFSKFRERYCYPIPLGETGLFRWEPKPEMFEELNRKIFSVGIRISKDDCLDLPEKVFSVRDIILPPKAMSLYKKMAKESIVTVNDDTILAEFPIVEYGKLRQMSDGILMNSETKVVHKIHDEKMKELDHLIESTDGQIIVWTNYRETVREIAEKYNALTYYSLTKNKRKNEEDFLDGKNRIIVCHPGSAGHGITWVNCSTVIYFNLPESLEYYLQSQDRVHRIGQVNKCTYYILRAVGTLDVVIWNRLEKNEEFQDDIINEIKQRRKDVSRV
jgi:SNF2 family DNA or RNA helicase